MLLILLAIWYLFDFIMFFILLLCATQNSYWSSLRVILSSIYLALNLHDYGQISLNSTLQVDALGGGHVAAKPLFCF